MYIDFEVVKTAYLADNAGVTLVPQQRCQDGHPAFGLTFPGRWIGQNTGPDLPEPLTVLVSRGTATHMAAAFVAFLIATEGPEAAEAFADEARTTCRALAPAIRELQAQGRDCCQAAYRTGGREHTCNQNGAQQ